MAAGRLAKLLKKGLTEGLEMAEKKSPGLNYQKIADEARKLYEETANTLVGQGAEVVEKLTPKQEERKKLMRKLRVRALTNRPR